MRIFDTKLHRPYECDLPPVERISLAYFSLFKRILVDNLHRAYGYNLPWIGAIGAS